MKIQIINPPHPSIGSRIPNEHLPPLGLLAIGGPLIDAGHDVHLLDAEFGPMPVEEIVNHVLEFQPEAVLLGHSGSTSGHPIIIEIARLIHISIPGVKIIYGGVFPTYHWSEILRDHPEIDYIVRGEGEQTIVELVDALENNQSLSEVKGIAYRKLNKVTTTYNRPMIQDLDNYRVGWELIDLKRYSYWGHLQAVVIQFSRGCPHHCNYCGQRGFWTKWRHRDPQKLADEIEWLHKEHGVKVFNFADENPSSHQKAWKQFLEAIIAKKLDIILVGSTRADDIVRDEEHLYLYKQAGFERFLLGIENYDEQTLLKIKKGGSTLKDRKAIELLRKNNILAMATWCVGFEEETDRDYWNGLKQLLSYDPDQIQLLYATPHRWTGFYRESFNKQIVQPDQRRWDYKHQIVKSKKVPAWRVLFWVKFIEVTMQMRLRALKRVLFHPDKSVRRAQRWYYRIGRKVWFYEVWNFFFRDTHLKDGETVGEFWGAPQDHEEKPLAPYRSNKKIRQLDISPVK